ncbi:MAG: hypothetical protein KDC38_04015, partial [Planctomycetes bacterium]|nr:hypothetical protein [Planctomycetota bacterium]
VLGATQTKLREIKGQKTGGSRARIKTYASPMRMFLDITTAIDSVRPPVYPNFTAFILDPELNDSSKTTIRYEIESIEDHNRIVDAIAQHAKLLNVKTNTSKSSSDGGFDATVELEFRPDQLPKK